MKNQIYISSGKAYEKFSVGPWEGYRPVELPECYPYIRWSGGKLLLREDPERHPGIPSWENLLAFFYWQHEKTGGESQAVLYLNPTTGVIFPWVRAQRESSTMSTDELPDHANRQEDDKLFKDHIVIGSVHHHCKMSAFQSGEDRADEITQPGLHITLGKLDEEVWDLHTRVLYMRPGEVDDAGNLVCAAVPEFYEKLALQDWFLLAPEVLALGFSVCEALLEKYLLVTPPSSDVTFLERWANNLIPWSESYQGGGTQTRGLRLLPDGEKMNKGTLLYKVWQIASKYKVNGSYLAYCYRCRETKAAFRGSDEDIANALVELQKAEKCKESTLVNVIEVLTSHEDRELSNRRTGFYT